jgi:hypothetical protein
VDDDVYWVVICDEGYPSSLAAATIQLMGLRNAADVVGGSGVADRRSAGQPARCTHTAAAGSALNRHHTKIDSCHRPDGRVTKPTAGRCRPAVGR